jgi:methylase of polypeptide subunit release factors
VEIDHYLFAGRRDWTKPFRALVAGGGTGDALIQLAQVLASAGRKAEITYLDLSTAARRIAEARAAARGLTTSNSIPDRFWMRAVSVNSTTSTVAACCTTSPTRRRASTRWRGRWPRAAGSA